MVSYKNGFESICFHAMTCAPQEIQAALAATSGLDTGATDEAEAELQAPRRTGPSESGFSFCKSFILLLSKFQALYAQQSQKEAEEAMEGLWMDSDFFGILCGIIIVGTLRPWPSSRVVEEYLLPLPPHQLAMLHLQPKRLPWLLELRLDGGWWMM